MRGARQRGGGRTRRSSSTRRTSARASRSGRASRASTSRSPPACCCSRRGGNGGEPVRRATARARQGAGAVAAAGRSDAAEAPRRDRRAGPRAGARQCGARGDRARRARVTAAVGSARRRQDDARAADRRAVGLHFEPFSAVLSGVKDVREATARAERIRSSDGRGTLLFVDEIHRFNKAQQDAFLPHVESGAIVLVGATTENPAFSINQALLSRCRIVNLRPLDDAAIGLVIDRALADERARPRRDAARADTTRRGSGCAGSRTATPAARSTRSRPRPRSPHRAVPRSTSSRSPRPRSSVPSRTTSRATTTSICSARSTSRCATRTCTRRSTGWRASSRPAPIRCRRRAGCSRWPPRTSASPTRWRCRSRPVHCSRSRTSACRKAVSRSARRRSTSRPRRRAAASSTRSTARSARCASGRQHPIPLHLRNAPTRLAKELGHGQAYRFAPREPGHVADMDCLPDALIGRAFYAAGDWGFEQKVGERLAEIERRRRRTDP